MNEQTPQEQSIRGNYSFRNFPLFSHKTPDFIEGNSGQEYILYGKDNSYPDYLIYLYNSSALHGAIIEGKTRFIKGQGLKNIHEEPKVDAFIESPNVLDDSDELLSKIIKDRRIFGGYAIKVVWIAGQPRFYHIAYDSVRTNKYKSKYYVSNEWTRGQSLARTFKSRKNMPNDVIEYPPYNPTIRVGEQIFYVVDYRPQTKVYTLPEYIGCMAAIDNDIEISNFQLNNTKTGFSSGGMMTFFNGQPDNETKEGMIAELKENTTGSDNAGNIYLNFATPDEKSPEFTSFKPNDLDKQFEQLDKNVNQKILTGHGVTSPMLFGIKTEGQLGGSTELKEAWTIFTTNYVAPKQEEFNKELSYLLYSSGVSNYKESVEIIPLDEYADEIDSAELIKALTKDEIRNIALKKFGVKADMSIKEDLLTTLNQISPLVANKILNSLSKNQILAMIGLPPIEGGEVIEDEDAVIQEQPTQLSKSEQMTTKLKKSLASIHTDNYEFAETLTDDEKKLLDYVKKKDKLDIKEATSRLKINVAKVLEGLIERNIIAGDYIGTEKNPELRIKKIQPPREIGEDVRVETRWFYAGPDDSKVREFCREMLDASNRDGSKPKLYTREQIDLLQNDMEEFNVDVWKYNGGWYHDPDTNTNYPKCRHYWQQKQVIIK